MRLRTFRILHRELHWLCYVQFQRKCTHLQRANYQGQLRAARVAMYLIPLADYLAQGSPRQHGIQCSAMSIQQMDCLTKSRNAYSHKPLWPGSSLAEASADHWKPFVHPVRCAHECETGVRRCPG